MINSDSQLIMSQDQLPGDLEFTERSFSWITGYALIMTLARTLARSR